MNAHRTLTAAFLTAAALTRLSGSRAYGVNATIHVHYSAGPPWRINIVTFDTPILSNASGSTGSYNIPTQFRGDQLATMEAVYTDGGGNAGPQNWTSFKEFDFTFAPNYSSNTITLKPEFFGEVNDNRIWGVTPGMLGVPVSGRFDPPFAKNQSNTC